MVLPIKPYLKRLYIGALVFFVVNKFGLRPLLADAPIPGWVEVVLYSSPNVVEAIIGMSTASALLLVLRDRSGRERSRLSDRAVYTVAAAAVGTYVLTQEFKLHDLGGRNVYDPMDAVASGVGVLAMWLLFLRFGIFDDEPIRVVSPDI